MNRQAGAEHWTVDTWLYWMELYDISCNYYLFSEYTFWYEMTYDHIEPLWVVMKWVSRNENGMKWVFTHFEYECY